MEKILSKPVIISLLCIIVVCTIISATADLPTVTRSAPITAKKGSTITINLTIDVDENDLPFVLGIEENHSAGVSIASASNGVSGDDSVEWILLNNSWYYNVSSNVTSPMLLQNTNLSYTIRIPAAFSSPNVTFEGITLSDSNSEIGGSAIVNISGLAGDADLNNYVEYADLLILARSYGQNSTESLYNSTADFNGDNIVDYADLLTLASNYGI